MTLFFSQHNARHPDLFQNLRKYSFCHSFLIAETHARHVFAVDSTARDLRPKFIIHIGFFLRNQWLTVAL
ncbi:hypothetical protein ACQZ6B_09140 [Agrobacterium vitis]